MKSLIFLSICSFSFCTASLPDKITEIMNQPKYRHASWGLFARDAENGKILIDYQSDKLFLPASTTKLFSVATLLHAYGEDYRFKTPVYTSGTLENGHLKGGLLLVGQGDLVFGGRSDEKDKISFTAMDHNVANDLPGVILTPQDPLNGLKELAGQVKASGIKEIEGNIWIDDSLFVTTEKRGMQLAPLFINENLIDIVITPTKEGGQAELQWRPVVPGYKVINEVKTGKETAIEVVSDARGHAITAKGTIGTGEKPVVRVFPIKDPAFFARMAFIAALEEEGIVVAINPYYSMPLSKDLKDPVAVFVSPPLSEYAKLILKVSHNLGANLVPLLLAAKAGKKTYEEGMLLIGEFLTREVKLDPSTFVFVDAAGGNDNRLTPQTEVNLLSYLRKVPFYQSFFQALPILGVDGSLADFGKQGQGVGRVHAKTGTGVSYNLALNQLFLTTQALSGYIQGKSNRLIEFMVVVNNAEMPAIEDIFPIFEDVSQAAVEIDTL
ncbi:MAG: D-alanyl-D-alanine carboxypeptidase/D-alanyl-D-alanine-endopeptidase [Parachlamydia sp.]|jgi:D-alanyl-D-alanine carboxypeptidase/D-alanyl-D-alanine-endopeptidase (penicillin-binding protein 4)|nr:D-alanyl-D-alanine carboxypeptidase/D-alanyl-D-alanine-endopeptidase [Parachlamydia sp.]